MRALGIRGCAISMPVKEDVIPLVDELAPSAAALRSVNTVVNDDGRLTAYNTDYTAIRLLLERRAVPADTEFALRGSGGMARAVAGALYDAGFRHGTVLARNEAAGRALAARYGFDWRPEAPGPGARLLVNATPIGMAGGPEAERSAFEERAVVAAGTVFELVAQPVETPLVRAARAAGVAVITGAEVLVLQAVEQFELYTGVRPDDALVARAAAHARG
nr:shikimate 5-dehydrogenase [Streptomyces sp. TLI_235]